MNIEILKALNEERAARRAAIVVTDTATGIQRFVKGADVAKDPLRETLEKYLRMGKSGMEETPQGNVFLTVHVPPPRLIVIGAVHISQALAPIAKLLDYDVTIIDPRTAFASPERFPNVKLIAEWPEVALPPLNVDKYTAFVLVTHDLEEAISLSDAVYLLGQGPRAHIIQRYDVPIPRPRDPVKSRLHPAFTPLHAKLWEDLSKEVDHRAEEAA